MKLRMLIPVAGSFHGIDNVVAGQVVEVDDNIAGRYLTNGMAVKVGEPSEERAVVEPDEAVETAVPKRKVGRPRKQPEWHDEDAPGWKKVGDPE